MRSVVKAKRDRRTLHPSAVVPKTPFLPSLEGLRAIACSGIIITHVAFQTGNDTGNLLNRVMARTDFFVPVFFALSGFLLWRRHRAQFSLRTPIHAATDGKKAGFPSHTPGWLTILGYYVKRLGRIMPAVWVTMAAVFLVFPVAREHGEPSIVQVIANFGMAQVFFADGLVGGLTHLWSLSVELSFYLVLPLIGMAIGRRRRAVRVTAIVAMGLVSYGWAFLPPFTGEISAGQVNPHTLPPAFAAWFAVGLLAAEAESYALQHPEKTTGVIQWIYRLRPLWWLLALAALVVAASDGPQGLVYSTPAEFARRTVYGTVFAAALIVPYALAPRSRLLESAPMQALGRWSYAIFLWHMGILSLVFPLLGIPLFSGDLVDTAIVLLVTFALTVPVAALSYSLVEEPARVAIGKRWAKYAAEITATRAN